MATGVLAGCRWKGHAHRAVHSEFAERIRRRNSVRLCHQHLRPGRKSDQRRAPARKYAGIVEDAHAVSDRHTGSGSAAVLGQEDRWSAVLQDGAQEPGGRDRRRRELKSNEFEMVNLELAIYDISCGLLAGHLHPQPGARSRQAARLWRSSDGAPANSVRRVSGSKTQYRWKACAASDIIPMESLLEIAADDRSVGSGRNQGDRTATRFAGEAIAQFARIFNKKGEFIAVAADRKRLGASQTCVNLNYFGQAANMLGCILEKEIES